MREVRGGIFGIERTAHDDWKQSKDGLVDPNPLESELCGGGDAAQGAFDGVVLWGGERVRLHFPMTLGMEFPWEPIRHAPVSVSIFNHVSPIMVILSTIDHVRSLYLLESVSGH